MDCLDGNLRGGSREDQLLDRARHGGCGEQPLLDRALHFGVTGEILTKVGLPLCMVLTLDMIGLLLCKELIMNAIGLSTGIVFYLHKIGLLAWMGEPQDYMIKVLLAFVTFRGIVRGEVEQEKD